MHIKDQTAEELFKAWDLGTGDKDDILSALAEAFMVGAAAGGHDNTLLEEAIEFKQDINDMDAKLARQSR